MVVRVLIGDTGERRILGRERECDAEILDAGWVGQIVKIKFRRTADLKLERALDIDSCPKVQFRSLTSRQILMYHAVGQGLRKMVILRQWGHSRQPNALTQESSNLEITQCGSRRQGQGPRL
jgi:hypothetical protein